ncbi:MAG: radical SAM protein, partial [Desulfurococcaceae archaeon]
MIKFLGEYRDGRVVYYIDDDLPVFGYIAFGVIDRGTNVLQVRPTTICPQNCIFCSVDAGLKSEHRWAEYIVKPDLLIR